MRILIYLALVILAAWIIEHVPIETDERIERRF